MSSNMSPIKHKTFWKKNVNRYGDDIRYVCNHACNITNSKVARNDKQVTCKNCLRAMANEKKRRKR